MATTYEVDVTVRGDLAKVRGDVETELTAKAGTTTALVLPAPEGDGLRAVVVVNAEDASLAERRAVDLVLGALRARGVDAAEGDLDVVARTSS